MTVQYYILDNITDNYVYQPTHITDSYAPQL